MEIRESIKKILQNYHYTDLPTDEAINQILLLFSVVGRSEQLLCDHDYQPDTACGVDIHACTKCGDVI